MLVKVKENIVVSMLLLTRVTIHILYIFRLLWPAPTLLRGVGSGLLGVDMRGRTPAIPVGWYYHGVSFGRASREDQPIVHFDYLSLLQSVHDASTSDFFC